MQKIIWHYKAAISWPALWLLESPIQKLISVDYYLPTTSTAAPWHIYLLALLISTRFHYENKLE